MKKPNETSLANIILTYLMEKSTDLLDLSYKIVFDPENFIKDAGFSRKFPFPSSVLKNTYKLKYSPYFKNIDSKLYLTEKGRLEIIRKHIENKCSIKNWDNKWRAIIFDIPELKRKDRSFLRKELKIIGFKEIQKSIWVFPFDIENEIFALLNLWKKDFRGDIRFLKIEKIIDDTDIKKIFNL